MRGKLKSSIFNLLMFLAILGLVSSCGGKPAAKTEFQLRLGEIVTGTPMDGGIYLWAIEVDETGLPLQTLMLDLDANDSASIPFGTWELYLVGYSGPDAWKGLNYCGASPQTTLDSSEMTIQMTITEGDCTTNPIYQQMISEKAASLGGGAAVWGVALWDQATWQ